MASIEKRFLLTTQERKNSLRVGRETSITVEAMDGKTAITIPRVWTIEPLNVSENSIPTKKDVERWSHLQDIDMYSLRDRKVKLLIGCNVPEAFFALEERRGEPGEPYGVRTILGWTVFGPSEKLSDQSSDSHVYFTTVEDSVSNESSLALQLERFWKLDFGDSLLNNKPCMSVDDSKALAIMESSLKKVDGHYQLGLPWKNSNPFMPRNRVLAVQRLNSLRRKLLHNEEIFKKYCITMNDYLDKGFAVKVPDEDLHVTNRPVWFLPHHGVFHPRKPGKLRVVFDCAAKYRGTSSK